MNQQYNRAKGRRGVRGGGNTSGRGARRGNNGFSATNSNGGRKKGESDFRENRHNCRERQDDLVGGGQEENVSYVDEFLDDVIPVGAAVAIQPTSAALLLQREQNDNSGKRICIESTQAMTKILNQLSLSERWKIPAQLVETLMLNNETNDDDSLSLQSPSRNVSVQEHEQEVTSALDLSKNVEQQQTAASSPGRSADLGKSSRKPIAAIDAENQGQDENLDDWLDSMIA